MTAGAATRFAGVFASAPFTHRAFTCLAMDSPAAPAQTELEAVWGTAGGVRAHLYDGPDLNSPQELGLQQLPLGQDHAVLQLVDLHEKSADAHALLRPTRR